MENKRRLIDVNQVLAKQTSAGIYDADGNQYGCADIVFIEDIINAPTVDAVEVVHGKWVNPYINRYGHPCHCCSVCGFKASYQDKNYCPNCGAKMNQEALA